MNKKSGLLFVLYFVLLSGALLLTCLIYFNSEDYKKMSTNLSDITTIKTYDSNITTNVIDKSNLEFETLYDNKSNQVPIYVFYGNGCDKCNMLFEFFNSLDISVKNKFVIYKYNVWSNSENKKLMFNYAALLETKIYGIPFIVIGDKTYYKGYNESKNSDIVNTISTLYNNKEFNKLID